MTRFPAMRPAMQITALVLIGVLVTEFALWASTQEGAWWLVILPALLVYIGILSSMFMASTDAWLLVSARKTFQIMLGTTVRSAAICVVLLPILVVWGIRLSSTLGTGVLTVQVYSGGTNPDQRLEDVSVFIESIKYEADRMMRMTDSRGVAKFRVRENDYLNVAIRMNRSGRIEDGAVTPIIPPPWFLPVDVKDIPGDAWSNAQQGTRPQSRAIEIDSAALASLHPSLTSPSWIGDLMFVEPNAPWGLPSRPSGGNEPLAEYIVARKQYVLGFDPERHIPRWVANAIRPYTVGHERPRRISLADPDLPIDIQAQAADYRGSGYDRGTLISGSDIAFHGSNEPEVAYYMSITTPQTPIFNRSVWLRLEQYSRRLANQHGVVYVVSGSVFSLRPDERNVDYILIGEGRVGVPVAFFRIVARTGTGNNPELLAFLIPNNVTRDDNFADFTVAVDTIETLTGLNFFPNLADESESLLESQIPSEIWSVAER